MNPCRTLFPALLLLPCVSSPAQDQAPSSRSDAVILPAGTPLPVILGDHIPMKAGQPIRAELIYPVYDHDRIVLPARTIVTGSVVSLTPDRTRRIHARLRADFTPFHTPVVRFTGIVLPDGSTAPLFTGTAADGTPIYRLVPPPQRKGGFIAQQIDTFKQATADQLAVITAPEKKDRFIQFLYTQLPYHPERIAAKTSWTVETAAPLPLSTAPASPITSTAPADTDTPATWNLQAWLTEPISSATSKPGEAIRAVVAEPVLNPDGTVAVPQGSVLTGAITKARPGRSLGRAGQLSFSFNEIVFPGSAPQPVQAALTGADGEGDLAMNSEGEIKQKPKDKIIVPLILLGLAARPLDRDHGDHNHQFAKDAAGSNSLGFIGFIVGTAAQQANLAAGIGYYGAAISIYERVFRKGKEVAFTKDTRIVLQTTARRSAPMKASVDPQ